MDIYVNTTIKITEECSDKSYLIGVSKYSRDQLEKVMEQNKILDIKVVGMVVISEDINEEVAVKTIKSLKVFGVLKASPEIKKVLKQ